MTKQQAEIMIKLMVAQISAMAMLHEDIANIHNGNPTKYTSDHFKRLVARTGALDLDVSVEGDDRKVYFKDESRPAKYYVKMRPVDHKKLVDTYGLEFTSRCIEKLGNYKIHRNKSYNSDYHAILTWVVKSVEEEGFKPNNIVKRKTGVDDE